MACPGGCSRAVGYTPYTKSSTSPQAKYSNGENDGLGHVTTHMTLTQFQPACVSPAEYVSVPWKDRQQLEPPLADKMPGFSLKSKRFTHSWLLGLLSLI